MSRPSGGTVGSPPSHDHGSSWRTPPPRGSAFGRPSGERPETRRASHACGLSSRRWRRRSPVATSSPRRRRFARLSRNCSVPQARASSTRTPQRARSRDFPLGSRRSPPFDPHTFLPADRAASRYRDAAFFLRCSIVVSSRRGRFRLPRLALPPITGAAIRCSRNKRHECLTGKLLIRSAGGGHRATAE